MMPRRLPARVSTFLALALALAVPVQAKEPAPERRAHLVNLVRQDCGSCHGLTMKGGLGPPLLPAVIAGRDAEQMAFVILNGRPGTPMPPWREFLNAGEAEWIVEQLRKGLPQ